MYNEASIQSLIDRIGWNDPVPPTDLVLADFNSASTSGRFFNAFHPLATIETVSSSIENKKADSSTVNELLYQLKTDGVMKVLNDVYNLNTRATSLFYNDVKSINYMADYSNVIVDKQDYFDEVIGYSVAIKALQLLLASSRSNRNTVSGKTDFEATMGYLEGFISADGVKLTEGLLAKYDGLVKKLINVLFPLDIPEGATVNPDGSIKRPTLKARRLW